ncbi:MAG: outer membrane protein transport protein [candidate division Zixibacteria bacterium]|nr:outer membrane protein transport protein [candidate division Zixibacteria bacterium]
MGFIRYAAVLSLLLLLSVPTVFGGGFVYDGLGVKARGMGGAFRAVADDWSAAYYNPAGYGWIPDNMLAGNIDFFHNRYSVTPNVLWDNRFPSGYYNDIEHYNMHRIENVPQGGILFRLPVLEETVFGLSIMQTFDQNLGWGDIFGFDRTEAYGVRTLPESQFDNNLDVVAFQLTAARTFSEDKLSIGIGLSVLRADLRMGTLLMRRNPLRDDAEYSQYVDRPYENILEWTENDGYGMGLGYRAGVMYKPDEKLTLGLTYSGSTSIDIDGNNASIYYMPNNATLIDQNAATWVPTDEVYHFFAGEDLDITADFETTLDLPSTIGGGISYQATERLLLAVDAEMVMWSQFEGFEFTYSNYSGLMNSSFHYINDSLVQQDYSYPVDWDNTFRVMVGATYQAKSYMELRAGFGYDQTPYGENTGDLLFYDLGDKYYFSGGVGFDIGFWRVEVAGVYTHQPDLTVSDPMDINNDGITDNFVGTYTADKFQTLLGFSYRF